MQQVEGLGAGGPRSAGVWPHVASVVLVNARVQVSQVNHLHSIKLFIF